MQQLSSKGLVITRKRKKWKFAHFDSWENCFALARGEDPQNVAEKIQHYFAPRTDPGAEGRRLVLELAAGNAQFSLELARRYPQVNFIAIDVKSDRLYTSAKKALQENVSNIAFLRLHLAPMLQHIEIGAGSSRPEDDGIGALEGIFGRNTVDEIWITFPDPYPKKRSAKHRLTHMHYLRQYRNILKKTGQLKFKTDNRELFLWSLEQFVTDKWQFDELSFDLHESLLADDYRIMTYYEQKFSAQGIPTNFVSLSACQK